MRILLLLPLVVCVENWPKKVESQVGVSLSLDEHYITTVCFTIVLYVCYLLWNDFMCILLYMIMCMLLSATSTHFMWELILYCLHCPTLNKFVLLLPFAERITPSANQMFVVELLAHADRRWVRVFPEFALGKVGENGTWYWVSSWLP